MTAIDGAVHALATAGLDIAHRFDAGAIATELALPRLAAAPLGILVGNTRALWSALRAARSADAELRASADPVERYVEAAMARAFTEIAPIAMWFSHRRYDGAFLPFQRVAEAAGLGGLAPTGLVIHPDYGPWFALRAIVLVDGTPPPRRGAASPCHCGEACTTALARARAGGSWRDWLAVRDACSAGRSWRYSDGQISYHYTADRRALDCD
jgi:methylmalonic aciduria homocystinuria type C protein